MAGRRQFEIYFPCQISFGRRRKTNFLFLEYLITFVVKLILSTLHVTDPNIVYCRDWPKLTIGGCLILNLLYICIEMMWWKQMQVIIPKFKKDSICCVVFEFRCNGLATIPSNIVKKKVVLVLFLAYRAYQNVLYQFKNQHENSHHTFSSSHCQCKSIPSSCWIWPMQLGSNPWTSWWA